MENLIKLSTPFPARYISTVNKAGRSESYVSHSVITQALLAVLGPFTWEIPQMQFHGEGEHERCDVIGVLRVNVDGRDVSVSSTGTDQAYLTKDGKVVAASAQNAEAQAFKRAASKIGLGLHLWAQDEYFLHDRLKGGDDE